MEKIYKVCQSCGMPMKKDPANGGTNTDGAKINNVLQFLLSRWKIYKFGN